MWQKKKVTHGTHIKIPHHHSPGQQGHVVQSYGDKCQGSFGILGIHKS